MALATCVATAVERHRPLPADGMVPDPLFTSTHAITVDAPPEQVWPWIAQMGAGRAGWYSWDATDNGGAPSHQRIFIERVYAALARLPRPLLIGFAAIGHRVMEARHLRGIQRRSTARTSPGAFVERWRKPLLTCGMLASVLYVAMTLFVGTLWGSYRAADQTISELSAIGAPTRPLWMVLGTVYTVLIVAFGWIVWAAAPPNRAQRVVGMALMLHGAFGCFWPPMNQRAVLAASGPTLSDTLHIAWAIVTGIFFLFETGSGAAAFGRRFRVYSIATIVIVLTCGAITGTYTSQVQADLPTPWLGVWERASSTAYMLWIAVLAATLLREGTSRTRGS